MHAWKLEFNHPITGKKISLEAEIPEYLKNIIKELEGDYTPLYAKKRKTIYICTKYHTGYHQYPLPVAQK